MMIVIVGSAAAAVVLAIAIVLIMRRGRRSDERGRKTMMIAAALPFVSTTEPGFLDAPQPQPPPRQPHVVPSRLHTPLDDDGPTTADPRYARVAIAPAPPDYPRRFARATSSVEPPLEGPTIRGPGVPPNRPDTVRSRDANIRAAIRANTLHATIKPRR